MQINKRSGATVTLEDGSVVSFRDYLFSILPPGKSQAMTPQDIHKNIPAVSFSTVYNYLRDLARDGEIKHYRNPGERPYRYYRPTPKLASDKIPYIYINGEFHPISKYYKDVDKLADSFIPILTILIGAYQESSLGNEKAYVRSLTAAQEYARKRIVRLQNTIEMLRSFLDDEYTDTLTAYENGSFEALSTIALEDADIEAVFNKLQALAKTSGVSVDLTFILDKPSQ
jgi:hypothetical protein